MSELLIPQNRHVRPRAKRSCEKRACHTELRSCYDLRSGFVTPPSHRPSELIVVASELRTCQSDGLNLRAAVGTVRVKSEPGTPSVGPTRQVTISTWTNLGPKRQSY